MTDTPTSGATTPGSGQGATYPPTSDATTPGSSSSLSETPAPRRRAPERGAGGRQGSRQGRQADGDDLVTEKGRTTIADAVVAKITGIAARDVSGVHDLGGGASRAVGVIRERIPGASTNLAQGVSVEVGERQAAADIDIVAEYGVALPDLAAGIRQNVITSVERMTGLEVTEVNVTVNDVYVDTGEDEEEQESRVQ